MSQGLGELVWALGFDNTGLKKGTQEAGVEFEHMGKTLKEAMSNQKQLIKEITLDIKNLNEAAKSGTFNQKTGAMADMTAAKKVLADEQARLLDMQKKSIEGNGTEEKSQGGLIAGLGKWAIGLATVAAATKVFHSIMESTEATAHTLEQGIAGASSATSYFFQTIATGDWSNFLSGMAEAVKGAVDYVDAMEEVQRLKNSNKVTSADIDVLKAEALSKTWDKSKANRPVRIKGLRDVIGFAEMENLNAKNAAEKEYNAELAKSSTDTGKKVSEAEILKIITWGKEIKVLEELGDKYNDLNSIKLILPSTGQFNATAGNKKQYEQAQISLEKLRKEAKESNIDLDEAGKAADKIGIVTFKAMDKVANAYKALGTAKALVKTGPIFQQRQLQQALNQDKADDEAVAKKKKEDAELDNRIKATEELMKSASGRELDDLAKKLVLLEAEKKLRDELIKLKIFEAKYGDKYTPETLGTQMVGKNGQIVTTKKPTKGTAQDLIDTSKGSIKRNEKEIKDLTDEENKAIKEQYELRIDVLNAAQDLTGILVENNVLSEEQGQAIGQALEGFKGLAEGAATGNYLQAALSIASMLGSLLPSQAEEFQARIDKINLALDYQRRLIELSDRRGGQEVGRLKEIELLKEKQKLNEEALARAEDKRSGKIFKIGPVYKGYVKDVEELTAAVLEDKQAVEAANIALADFYTGGTTENTISGAIRNGFEDGKQSASDFASTFEDFMRTAINSSLEELSKPEIAAWYKEFAADMASGGGLDQQETKTLKDKWDKIIADNEARRLAAYGISGIDANAADIAKTDTAAGQIKAALTEDTGTQLMGLWRRGIDENITQTGILSMSNGYLYAIEINTRRTADNTEFLKTSGTTNGRDKG